MFDWWSAMSHEPEAQDRSIEACDPEGGRSRSKEEVLRETVYQIRLEYIVYANVCISVYTTLSLFALSFLIFS